MRRYSVPRLWSSGLLLRIMTPATGADSPCTRAPCVHLACARDSGRSPDPSASDTGEYRASRTPGMRDCSSCGTLLAIVPAAIERAIDARTRRASIGAAPIENVVTVRSPVRKLSLRTVGDALRRVHKLALERVHLRIAAPADLAFIAARDCLLLVEELGRGPENLGPVLFSRTRRDQNQHERQHNKRHGHSPPVSCFRSCVTICGAGPFQQYAAIR